MPSYKYKSLTVIPVGVHTKEIFLTSDINKPTTTNGTKNMEANWKDELNTVYTNWKNPPTDCLINF